MKTDHLNILIPTDFSDNAWSATNYALHLYAHQKCTFYFLNSLALNHSDSRAYMTTRYVDVLTETSKRELAEVKAKALALNNSLHGFEVISTSEPISPAIKRAVKRYAIDVVIAGNKGATGVERLIFGSTTVKMIEELEGCPLLAVPAHQVFSPPRHIAFPTDFNRSYTAREMDALLNFAHGQDAHIYVLHINLQSELSETQNANMRLLQGLLEGHRHTFHWKEKTGTKADGINKFLDEFDIDLLAMVHYKHSFIENIIKEPVIKNIGIKPEVPFLVIPQS